MVRVPIVRWFLVAALAVVVAFSSRLGSAAAATVVRFETVMGNFDIQLSDATMPRTVTNFLHYVTSNKYDGTVVHRNSDSNDGPGGSARDFVIQGGGFKLTNPTAVGDNIIDATSVVTIAPITDEPGGGVTGPSNLRGTIAMAKSGPNTVTSQWFINQGNNSFLDSPLRSDGGFSAFGMVLGNGMQVVDAIGDLPLPPDFGFSIGSPFGELPLRNFAGNNSIDDIREIHTVVITDVRVLNLLAGDFDRNGAVNAADLTILKTNYGLATGAFVDKGDANMDGDVDGHDFLLWQRNVGKTNTPATSVPEPAAGMLAAFATLGLARLNRRKVGKLVLRR